MDKLEISRFDDIPVKTIKRVLNDIKKIFFPGEIRNFTMQGVRTLFSTSLDGLQM